MRILFKDYKNLTHEESITILTLRNEENIRKNMIDNQIIELSSHIKFINSLKDNSNKNYFAIICNEEVLGSLSFVKDDKNISWGVFFKNDTNPFITSFATFLFLEYLFANISNKIFSLIKKENSKALNFNKNFGFEVYKEDENIFYLELKKCHWESHKNSKLLKPIKNYLDKIEYSFE